MLAEDEFCGVFTIEVCSGGGVSVVKYDELTVLAGAVLVVVEIS
ncbi:hypothetical protein FRC0360_00723 [Corynebacterium diphtheriae]|nr:hypothetical protein FRC0360_00723 [Corynebacterium diphtheriae]